MNLWLKIRIWTKAILFGLVLLYCFVFLLMNTGQAPVKIWFWPKTELTIPPLLLVLVTLLIGVLVAILAQMIWTTVRQITDLRARNRSERLEREISEMKGKASMLQTKRAPSASPAPAPPPPSDPDI